MDLGKTLLAGALTLVIMTLPTIIRTTQESLKTVPQSYREGSLGLGAGKWHMIRTVVLPSSVDGIVTGCILAIGRMVGESAALIFTAGMGTTLQNFFGSFNDQALSHFLSTGDLSLLFSGLTDSSGATLTVALYVYAKERAEFDLAFSVAAGPAGHHPRHQSVRQAGGQAPEKAAKEDNYGSICHSLGLRAEPVLR